MSKIRTIKKSIQEQKMLFDNLSLTVYGSLILSIQALVPDLRTTEQEYIERFKKASLPFMDDKDFIKKTVTAFYNNESIYDDYVVGLPLCVCEGEKNTLFGIYVDGRVLPYRKDGFMPQTLYSEPKVINWDED
jgi:hypothetical protein